MQAIVDTLASLMTFLYGVVCFCQQVFLDPAGFVLHMANLLIGMIFSVLPSSPQWMKVSSLLDGLSESVPLLQLGEVREIFSGIAGMIAIYTPLVIYKLLPFKFS